MGIFDDFNKSRQMEKERNEQRKKAEAEAAANKKEKINHVLLNSTLGEPLYLLKSSDAKLWIYSDIVILDRTDGKILNAFNHTIKAIPIKNIKTLQFKNAGATPGFIEFGVSGNDASRKETFDFENENRFMYSYDKAEEAINVYFHILAQIK